MQPPAPAVFNAFVRALEEDPEKYRKGEPPPAHPPALPLLSQAPVYSHLPAEVSLAFPVTLCVVCLRIE